MGGLFGGGGSKKVEKKPVPPPTPAPPAPTLKSTVLTMAEYRVAAKRNKSYTKSALGGSAPNPTKSYTAQLFNATGSGF
jgi:hypothetical protein